MADDNPHIGADLNAIGDAVSRLQGLTEKTGRVVSHNLQRAEQMQQRIAKLEAQLERNIARAEPYRVVEQYPSGHVGRVRGYAATEEEAAQRASLLTPRPGAVTAVQPNPAFEPGYAEAIRKSITQQQAAYEALGAAIRGEAHAHQQAADTAIAGARAEQQAQAAAVSAQVEKARATKRSAEAEALAASRGLPAAGQSSFALMQQEAGVGYRSGAAFQALAQQREQADRAAGLAAQRPGTVGTPQPHILPLPAHVAQQTAAQASAIQGAQAALVTQQNSINDAVSRGRDVWTRNTAAIAGSSDALRRHGALTTEFIQAAARGEASYREWGYQIGATAGKFAGWTAVSIPIFAALDGIRQIGKGAVESANGVAQLSRFFDGQHFDPQAAQTGFREVSRDLNVGVGDVAQAQAQFARVFHNQTDSLTAARVALTATKLDQISAGDSFRYFTAIVQEGQVPISRLPVLFDQISAAQRRMGARAAETLPGVARALGAVRNAGGDLSQLIALVSTTQVATGQSGSSVGTAFYRGAATFFRRPDNQTRLRAFGVDPSAGFTQALVEAVRRARTLSGEQRIQMSQAFFGPQYGGRFAALFSRADQLDKTLRVTSPGVSQGSTAEELARVLRSPGEQFQMFRKELERLGAALGETGALGALTSFSLGLTAVTAGMERTLSVLNHVPPVLQEITFLGAGIAATRAVGRRFGIGEGSTGFRNLAFGRTEEQAARIAIRQSLRDQQEFIRQSTVGMATRARTAALGEEVAGRRLSSAVRRGQLPGESAEAHTERLAGLTSRLGAQRALSHAAEQDRAVLDQLSRDQIRLGEAYKEAARTGRYLDFATREAIYVVPTQDRPAYGQNPIIPGRDPYHERRLRLAGQVPGVNPEQLMFPVTGTTRAGALYEASERTRGTAFRYRAYADAFRQSATASQRVEVASKAVTAGAVGAGRAAAAAGAGLLRGAGSLLAMLGPLGVAFLGLDAVIAAYHAADDHIRRQVDDLDKHAGGSLGGRKETGDREKELLRKLADEPTGLLGRLPANRARREAEQSELNYLLERDRRQATAVRHGRPRVDISRTQFDQTFDAIKTSGKSVGDRIADYNRLLEELDLAGTDPNLQKNRAALAQKVRRARQNVQVRAGSLLRTQVRDLDQVDLKSNAEDIDNLVKFVETGRAKIGDVRRLFGQGVTQLARGSRDTSIHGQVAYQQRLEQLVGAIEGGARNELQRSLAAAKSQRDRNQAYSTYFRTVAQADDPLRHELGLAHERTVRAQHELAGSRGQRRVNLEAQVKGYIEDEKRLRQGLHDLRVGLTANTRAMSEQRFAEVDALAETQTQVNQYGFGSGYDRDQFLLQQIGLRVRQYTARYGSDSAKTLALIAQQRAQEEQVAQDSLNRITSKAALAASRTTDPIAQGRINLQGLRAKLAAMRADPKHTGGADAQRDVQTQINEAQTSLADQQQQQVDDLAAAQLAYRESLTDDPLKIARLEAQAADAVVKRGGFKGRAERLRALAERNTKRRDYLQLQQSSKAEDIEFELSMDQITVQDAIDKYTTILRSHNLSKQARRQYRQRVHDLQKQAEGEAGSFDLDVGAIKMPTIYDVRRAFDPIRKSVQAARRGMPQVINSYAQPTTGDALRAGRRGAAMTAPTIGQVLVQVTVNDPNAAGEVYHAIDRAMRTNVKAKMKSRGHRR